MMSDFRSDRLVKKARKAHACTWCREVIPAGSQYAAVNGCSEGLFFRGQFHPECYRAEHGWWELHVERGTWDEYGWPEEAKPRGVLTDQAVGLWEDYGKHPLTEEEVRGVRLPAELQP